MAKVHLGPSPKLLEILSKPQKPQKKLVKLKSSTQTSVFKTKHSNTNVLNLSYINFTLNKMKSDAKEILKVLIFVNWSIVILLECKALYLKSRPCSS